MKDLNLTDVLKYLYHVSPTVRYMAEKYIQENNK
jgi:hypothetical protein